MPKHENPGPSIDDLIARTRSGDASAREELFRRSMRQLEHWRQRPKKQVGHARPSDLAQNAYERALRSFESFKGTTEKAWFAWLKQIFKTSEAQAVRDSGRQKRDLAMEMPFEAPEDPEMPAPELSPSHATAVEELWQQVFRQIFELPEDQKEAIWLCHLKENSVAEVAKQMRKGEKAVAGLLQRGLGKLRDHFARETEGEAPCPPAANQRQARAALLAYLRMRDKGQKTNIDTFLEAYPACAEEVRGMLEWIEKLQEIRSASPARKEEDDHSGDPD